MSSQKVDELLTKGITEIIGKDDLIKKIKSGKKLRIKYGIDPTTSDLTLGYAVNFQKLKEFQETGHKIVFLIGDFTGRFGDPSDKLKMRQMREGKKVKELAKNYINQAGKILDLKKTEIRYNSEWYDKMSAEDLLHLMSKFTVARMLERDMFQERIKNKLEINLHEPVYPILQGYDSVMLKCDAAVCGNDQKFNELQGRKIQEDFDQDPQAIIITPLLIGIDGKNKMSQSLGNYIGINESAKVQFGKIMSIPDNLIIDYYELVARISGKELIKIKNSAKKMEHFRNLKADLARTIVEMYHGIEEAVLAENEFNRVFRDKELPIDIPEVKIRNPKCEDLPQMLFDLKLATSKSDARRLIEQGGVRIDKAVISDYKADICFHDKMVIQVGKLKFIRVRL
jgi:tyrosyl-tRNA synthetase